MKISKLNRFICLATVVALAFAAPDRLSSQTAPGKSSPRGGDAPNQPSIQVERIETGEIRLADSFQVAIYESLLEELNKNHQFKHVFREGDRNAGNTPNLLILRTTVVKYTRGSETRRAVTTVSGATKLDVKTQLATRDGRVVLDRTVNGSVRFFGSNLRATHNLAHNIAKVIKEARLVPKQPDAAVVGRVNTDSAPGGHS